VEEAQDKICPDHSIFSPEPAAQRVYNSLYPLYQKLYFSFGRPQDTPLGDVLPKLILLAQQAN